MNPLDRAAWEVLNATADDWENLEGIYRLIPPGVVSLQEVADHIPPLVEGGLLTARMEGGGPPDLVDLRYVWRAWFAMTPQGRAAWSAAVPADLVK